MIVPNFDYLLFLLWRDSYLCRSFRWDILLVLSRMASGGDFVNGIAMMAGVGPGDFSQAEIQQAWISATGNARYKVLGDRPKMVSVARAM